MLLGVLSLSAKDFGRIDLDGFSNRIPLTPLTCKGAGVSRNPQPARKDYALEARMWANPHFVWQTTILRFKAEKSGVITLQLLANWLPKEKVDKHYHGKYPRAIYRSVEAVKGCKIVNPNFADLENGTVKGWKVPVGADYKRINIDGTETPVVIGRCYAPVSQNIEVVAGEEVELKVVWALEVAFQPPFWMGCDGKDIYTPVAERIIRGGKYAVHPHVLFRAEDLSILREKLHAPFWSQYWKDLVAEADFYLEKYPDDFVFLFTENPTMQLVTETFLNAYLATGASKYAKKAIRLSMNFINAYFLKKKVRMLGKFRDYLGLDTNSVRPLALFYDILFHEMSDTERIACLKMLNYMGDLCMRMTENQPYFDMTTHKNYLMGQMGAFALLALAVRGELPQAEQWLKTASGYLDRFTKQALRKDGMFPEGTSYFNYTGENLLLAYAAMENGKALYWMGNLPLTLKWSLWSLLPWKVELDNFSDANHTLTARTIPALFQHFDPECGSLYASLAYGAKPRFTSNNSWLWLYLKETPQPTEEMLRKALGLSANFPFAGMSSFCDSWGNDAAKVFFYATSYHFEAHSQADRGHFNFYSHGFNWAGDSGYGNDGKGKNSANSWEAHSQVLIDGKGESYLPGTRVSGTFSIIADYMNLPGIGYSAADLKPSYDYGVWYNRRGGVRPNVPVQKAMRHLLFMRNNGCAPTYLLVYDDIRKDDSVHAYDWQMQTEPTNTLHIGNGSAGVYPLSFSGEVMDFCSTGDWNSPKKDGYNIFGNPENSKAVFEFNSPREGRYVLWSLGCGRPFVSGVEFIAFLNGKRFSGNGRFVVSPYYARPVWARYTRNLGWMSEPEFITLKKGKNRLELSAIAGIAQLKKLVLVPDAKTTPEDLEHDILPPDSIVIDSRNLVSSETVDLLTLPKTKSVFCSIRAIWPEKTTWNKDYFQPSRTPMHPRLRIGTNAIEPEFLIMLLPCTEQTPFPEISRSSVHGVKIARIAWKNGYDLIALNPAGVKFALDDLETDGKLTVVRTSHGKKEILSTKAGFMKQSEKKLYQGPRRTVSVSGGTTMLSEFQPIPMPTDSL